MRIILATRNSGKVRELKELLSAPPALSLELISAEEAGVQGEAVEDGKTFTENAFKKADFVGKQTGEWVVADDSGLCVNALNDRPGVHSARWAGEGAPPEKWVEKLLREMEFLPPNQREAHFETVAVLRAPDGRKWKFVGLVVGTIASVSRGVFKSRLPYDSVFVPNGHERTFAEMTEAEKDAISHRGKAARKLKKFLTQFLAERHVPRG